MGLAEMEERARRSSTSSTGTKIAFALLIVGGIGAAVAVFVVMKKVDHHRLVHQHGRADGSVVANGIATVIDDVMITHRSSDQSTGQTIEQEQHETRLTSIDVSTGAQLAQKLIDHAATCAAAVPGALWCNLDHLRLLDARTLESLDDIERTIEKSSGRTIVHSNRAGTPEIVGTVEGSKVTVLLDDGRVAVYDAATRTPTTSDVVPKQLQRGMAGTQATLSFASTSCPDDPLGGTGRRKVAAGKRTSKDSYLEPALIGAFDPPLFVHHRSLDRSKDALQLSRLDASGGAGWTVDLDGGCEQIAVEAGRVVIATTNPAKRITAIDANTGAVAWVVGF